MKNFKLFKILLFVCSIFIVLFGFLANTNAQTLQRQSISTCGSSYKISETVLIRQTIGQPYSTIAFKSDKFLLHPGFQQSSNLKVDKVQNVLNLEIEIFPNPASEYIKIKGIEKASVEVYDLLGNLIISQKNVTENAQINLSKLSSGSYFVKIIDKAEITVEKISISH